MSTSSQQIRFVVLASLVLAASASLRGNQDHNEQVSMKEVRENLLAEIEVALGDRASDGQLDKVEATLVPLFKAMPKNEHGNLAHGTVRYVLHRYFVERHGWYFKGLGASHGEKLNTSSPASVMKDRVPDYLQDVFEKMFAAQGFSLPNLAVFAATLENLVHSESEGRLHAALRMHEVSLNSSSLSEAQVDGILDTYMTVYLLGGDMDAMVPARLPELSASIHEVYPGWAETQQFVRDVRQQAAGAGPAFGEAEVMRSVDEIGDRYGRWQDTECRTMKTQLLEKEDGNSGRILLGDFYATSLAGHGGFVESVDFLRTQGALDESDAAHPRVIVPNYVNSPSNCIASSSFYSLCCINECEGLMRHIEGEIAAPEAAAARVAEVVAGLASSTVSAPRQLPAQLLGRLEEVAAVNEGSVPLHGRLFAQWLHHAYPRECPMPASAGSESIPELPDDWSAAATGGEEGEAWAVASKEVMTEHAEQAQAVKAAKATATAEDVAELPWSSDEVLHVVRAAEQPRRSASGGAGFRSLMLLALLGALAWSLTGTVGTALRDGRRALRGDESLLPKAHKFKSVKGL